MRNAIRRGRTRAGPEPLSSREAAYRAQRKALREALKEETNVIYEIMNEPLSREWLEAPITAFHRWAADVVLREGTERTDFGCFRSAPCN